MRFTCAHARRARLKVAHHPHLNPRLRAPKTFAENCAEGLAGRHAADGAGARVGPRPVLQQALLEVE